MPQASCICPPVTNTLLNHLTNNIMSVPFIMFPFWVNSQSLRTLPLFFKNVPLMLEVLFHNEWNETVNKKVHPHTNVYPHLGLFCLNNRSVPL